ncbi:MAG TPA: DUF2997 domain-containing protein [Phycisphaerales bacterium]|nr:DUF2997 domain-containing protein [Phycisphaerales bacterium]
MKKPQFDITIGKDGKVTVKVHGVSGSKCLELSDMVKQIVGHEESRTLTGEYYGGGDVRYDTQDHTHTSG